MSTTLDSTQVLEQPTSAAATSWLRIPDEATLPEDLRNLFQAQRDRYGFVHPYFVGYSLNPDHLRRWFSYYDALQHGKGELSHREREIIAVVTSATNHCQSCVITHQAQLRDVSGDAAFAAAVAEDYRNADLTEREQALAEFAVKLTQLSSELSPDDLAPLRQAGLSDEAILEAGEIAAQFSLSNRLSKAFGWKVKPEQYRL
ncbi:MAG TPA: peroxidase-related enzyme [Coleofasciculaceae cyanobacterium]